MSAIKDGGPAFPVESNIALHAAGAAAVEGVTDSKERERLYTAVVAKMALGMSLRDYFAAKALAAMIGHEGKDYSNCGAIGVPKLAAWAYEYADAMLSAREVQS